jgi:exopolysaccharide biosynthesis polyprenyl glycosylphosphotransferase
MILVFLTFIDTSLVVSRAWVFASWAFSLTAVSLGRFLTRRVVYRLRSCGILLTPAVVVGTNKEATALWQDLADSSSSGLKLLGVITTRSAENGGSQLELGSVSELRTLIERHDIEEVIVAATAVNREELLSICEDVNPFATTRLRLSSGLYELLTTGVTVDIKGTVSLIGINKGRLEPLQALIKTTFEFVVALTVVLLLAPLLLLITFLIAATSPGPIIHRRRVLGVSGQEFDAFKFRTMYIHGDDLLDQHPDLKAVLEATHKLQDDPRITPIGKTLRRYSLDELPQLFNVLRGEMGIVGPRMISPQEANRYGQHKLNLLSVRPGITGLWQVSGRSDVTYDERIRLDMFYIRNYSIWLDLQILFVQTLPAVVSGRGAY